MEISIATRIGYAELVDVPPAIIATYIDVLNRQAEERKG